uniref:Uncharacterized protein n=1 Tax=Pyxicephalus adspersus TaxID=30357 RepID=A0AAV3AWH2_PYXAD|nr:TPA: hypothetical protein GDO54_007862 [Pyxicephalus adspersus]
MEEEAEHRARSAPGGRLDMSHGFVHHIRRNQKARSHGSAGLAEDDISEGSSSTDPEQLGNQLFCLEFEADNGEITSIIVYEDDDAEQVATKISVQNQLEARMKEALKRRIQEEITKRRVHR